MFREIARSKLDLPALGNPNKPMSAISFSSQRRWRISPKAPLVKI